MTTKTPTPDAEIIDLPKSGRRQRFTVQERRRLLDEAAAPGESVSSVARRYGVSPSLLFRWRRLMEQGGLEGLGAEEAVVPKSEAKQLRAQIRELQRSSARRRSRLRF
jgi:transposase